MTEAQFNRALILAKTPDAVTWLRWEGPPSIEAGGRPVIDLELFDGCALPRARKVVCTIEDVAKALKYHCQALNGNWLESDLAEWRDMARRQFTIYGDPIQEAVDQRREQRKREREEARWQAAEAERQRIAQIQADQTAAMAARAAEPESNPVIRRIRQIHEL